MTEIRRYRVWGRVQGVAFRAFVWREAREIGVAGWVRNRFDGSVEALVSGDADQHRLLHGALERGPRLSRVDRVDVEAEPGTSDIPADFEILRDA